MRALVTGGSGYLGSRLALCLAESGWEVFVPCRQLGCLAQFSQLKNLNVFVSDNLRKEHFDFVRATKPEVVFHLASLFIGEHSPNDTERLISSNILYGAELLDACVDVSAPYFVNAGSAWQSYQGKTGSVPANLYAGTKDAFESLLAFYCDASPLLSACTLRIPDTYGPGDPRNKLVSALVSSAYSGVELRLSPGRQELDLLHVDDVVSAFTAAVDLLIESPNRAAHSVFDISSSAPISIVDLVELIRGLGVTPSVRFGARPYRVREMMAPPRVLRPLKNWRPVVSLEAGIGEMIKSHSARS